MGRPRTDIQPRILHAARARFLEAGVDGASLRTIATDAKTSVGMIFYYFPTKDDLFMAVIEEVYAKLLADLEVVLNAKAPLKAKLERAFTRIGEASPEEVDVVRLVVREALVSSPRFQQVFSRFRRGHIGLLLGALQEAASNGEINPELPLPLVMIATFSSGALPQMLRKIVGDDHPLSAAPRGEVLAKASVDLLFRGIAGGRTEGRPTAGGAIGKRKERAR